MDSKNGTQTMVTTPGSQIAPAIEQDVASVKRMMDGLKTLYRDVLKADLDYGIIPGTQKPTLLKPGSEKILGMLNCAVEVEISDKIEDYDQGFFSYVVRASAVHRVTGQAVGAGTGACNSREKRYQRQDPFSLQNTILKMAKKRAQVDLALTVGMASEMFTQDLDDDADGAPTPTGMATPAQCALILKLTQSHVFSEDEKAKAWKFCEGNPMKDKAQSFIDRLQGVIKERKAAEKPQGTSNGKPDYQAQVDELGDLIGWAIGVGAMGQDEGQEKLEGWLPIAPPSEVSAELEKMKKLRTDFEAQADAQPAGVA